MAALALLAGAAGLARAADSDFRLTDQTSPVYYRYALVAGEKILVTGATEITGNLHSNDDVDLMNGSAVTGDVSAAGTLTLHGTVTGATEEGAAALTLPALASVEELRGIADRVVDGNLQLADAVIDEILFVDGNVRIAGSLDGIGTIVATGDIRLDAIDDGVELPLAADTRLSLIAFNDIRIEKNRSFRGVLYAGRDIALQKSLRLDGVAIAGRTISVDKDSRIAFVDFDTTAPLVTVVNPPDGAVLNTATLTVEATWSDEFSGLDLATVVLLLDGEDRTAEAEAEADGLRFTPAAPLADGAHTVEVSVADHSDNTGSATATFTVDTVAPVLAITAPPAEVLGDAQPDVVVTYSDATSGIDPASLEIALDGTPLAGCAIGDSSATCEPPVLAAGSHTVTASVRDRAGNPASATHAFELVLARPPVVMILAPTAPTTFDRSPAILVSYAPGEGGQPLDLASLTVEIDGLNLEGDSCVIDQNQASCEPVVLLPGPHRIDAAIAATDGAVGMASFSFELLVDEQAPMLTVDAPVDGKGVKENPVPVTGTFADNVGVAEITANGQTATLGAGEFRVEVPLVNGANLLRVKAKDLAGNATDQELVVYYPADETPPELTIGSLPQGAFVTEARPAIEIRYEDESGIDFESLAVAVNGQELAVECELGALEGRCVPSADLPQGAIALSLSLSDVFGNQATATTSFTLDSVPLEVSVVSPANGLVTVDDAVQVQGTVGDGVARVEVNGVPASLFRGSFSATVPLREGMNMLVALATKANGRTGASSVSVIRDLVAPIVRIDSPRDGFVSINDQIAVTGLVNDAVTGGVTPRVLVNGAEARVANGAFVLDGLQLVRGPNVVEAVGTDVVGNAGRHAITVLYQPVVGARIVAASGNGQVGPVNQTLSQPLVALVADDLGNPVAGRLVRFEVTRNSGTLRAKAGDEPARVVQVPTDGSGRASVLFTLGDATGEGNNRVRATALGVAGEVEFCVSGFAALPEKIVMTMGDNQRGAVGQPLPMPLIAGVFDRYGNPVEGVDVTFTVVKGTGHLDGAETVVRTTGIDGHAGAALTLGSDPGLNNNVVTASFAGLTGMPVTFAASGVAPGDPAQTRFSGVVLDNAHTPIPGTVVDIGGTSLKAVTDEQGQFLIENVPVGHIHLHIDPSGSPRPETFAPLAFETVTIAGQENVLGQPILLPALDTEGSKIVGGDQDVTLTMKGVEGVELTVFANSATFHDGSKTGRLTISQVHLDKVPMAPPDGAIFMAPTWTIQPHGVHFDPPARITIPNNGLPPGRLVDIYQFDHALNQFISVGKGTVSEDGATITSDPGFGITAAGWGGGAPPPPPPTCADGCPKCQKCENGSCVPDDGGDPGGACVSVGIGTEIQPAINLLQGAFKKLPQVQNIDVQVSAQAEACPLCCNGSVMQLGEITYGGQIEASAELEVVFSPLPPIHVDEERPLFGGEIEVKFDLVVGPYISMNPSVSAFVGGKADRCKGENCLTASGCGGFAVQVGGKAELSIKEIEVEIFGVEIVDIEKKTIGAALFGAGSGSVGIEYDSCAGKTSAKGCIDEITGNLEVDVLGFFDLSFSVEVFGGFGECCQ